MIFSARRYTGQVCTDASPVNKRATNATAHLIALHLQWATRTSNRAREKHKMAITISAFFHLMALFMCILLHSSFFYAYVMASRQQVLLLALTTLSKISYSLPSCVYGPIKNRKSLKHKIFLDYLRHCRSHISWILSSFMLLPGPAKISTPGCAQRQTLHYVPKVGAKSKYCFLNSTQALKKMLNHDCDPCYKCILMNGKQAEEGNFWKSRLLMKS